TRISSISTGLLSFLPLPNQAGVTRQNFRFIASNPNNTQSLNTRLNTSLTQKDTLGLVFNWQKRDSETNEYYGCCDSSSGQGINSNINWRHRFGARAFQNLVFNFNRNTIDGTPFFAFGPDVATALGIQGTSPDPRNYGPPNLSFTNYNSLSDTNASRSAVETFGFNDTFSIRRGKHNWSFGG